MEKEYNSDGKVLEIEKRIEKVERDIDSVEKEISTLSAEILPLLRKRIDGSISDAELDVLSYLREKKEYLRKEEEYLRKEEEYLRKEEEYLRKMELLRLPVELERMKREMSLIDSKRQRSNIFFCVRAKIIGSKTKKGIRCGMYYRASVNHGFYYGTKEKTFWYEEGSDDLNICVLFKAEESAMSFHSELGTLCLNHRFLGLGREDVEVERKIEEIELDEQPVRIMFNDYDGSETDSPLQDLRDFQGSVSSLSLEGGVSWDDPKLLYMGLERPELFDAYSAYKIHIKPKSSFPMLKNDENNILYGSWTPFHQFYDGMNVEDGIPTMVIRFEKDCGIEYVGESSEKRHRVEVVIKFLGKRYEKNMAPRFKNGSENIGELEWRSFLFVTDVDTIKECLGWKYEQTMILWQRMDDS
eukprot:TRINITY_DN365_c2_g1_i11.p2 TRINITY_DN365_c2_g1~~TRINITY_DN365_c2_g1_i11.p2  ORF type:complete len:413 (+),score=111.24 TRINITY_DN365_c2_g1_i11:105-1343(+)